MLSITKCNYELWGKCFLTDTRQLELKMMSCEAELSDLKNVFVVSVRYVNLSYFFRIYIYVNFILVFIILGLLFLNLIVFNFLVWFLI